MENDVKITPHPAAYQALLDMNRQHGLLGHAMGILGWEEQTQMAAGSAGQRGEVNAAMQTMLHEKTISPEYQRTLEAAESIADQLDAVARANLRESRYRLNQALAMPVSLVAEIAEHESNCYAAWLEAKAADNLAMILPSLDKMFQLHRRKGECLARVAGGEPYDALMRDYASGLSRKRVDALFQPLRSAIPKLIDFATACRVFDDPPIPLPTPFGSAQQLELAQKIAVALGFDLSRGRIDWTAHPFSCGEYDDVRITVADTPNELSSLFATIHETGHALYSQNMAIANKFQPVGEALGMAVHESQSLIWEFYVAQSDEFLAFLSPLLQQTYGGSPDAWTVANLAAHVRSVAPGFIRIEADEVCYPAHILLRYDIESALIEERLKLSDAEAMWNDSMKSLLGLAVPSPAKGILQDVHWFSGGIGYFPSYTLGAMMAAQCFEAVQGAVPGLMGKIQRGDFAPLLRWLTENIHHQGCIYPDVDSLLQARLGNILTPDAYLRHLQKRYG